MDPRGGRGTSADIVPTHIKFGVDLSTRCWDIAQKTPNCKNLPLTSIVTKVSFPPFLAPRGPLTPKRGEDTSGTRVRPPCKIWLESARWLSRNRWQKTNKQKTYSKPNTSPFALTSEWRVTNTTDQKHTTPANVTDISVTWCDVLRSRRGYIRCKVGTRT